MSLKVLVVDDDPRVRGLISEGLEQGGFHVVAVEDGGSSITQLRKEKFDVVICEVRMPEVDGLDVLRFTRSLVPAPKVIMMTGYGSVDVAVRAMKYGAAEFLEKPLSVDELRDSIHAVLSLKRELPVETPEKQASTDLVGASSWLTPFLTSLDRIAQTDVTVLIQGETGTGKSVVARDLWRMSSRAKGPFVEVNCAAIPEHLIESELFGHVRGAFTGATATRVGKVELAQGGTLFLDEIGELKLDLQAKLLHLLQERTFQPVGSTKTRTADVRFLAATNRDLREEVGNKNFRPDLYYRLNVVSLNIKPLRERSEDVPLLIEHFRHRVATRLKAVVPSFSVNAVTLLTRYTWPGNVRELENLVEYMTVIYPSTVITPEHLRDRVQHPAPAEPMTHAAQVPQQPVVDHASLAPPAAVAAVASTLPPAPDQVEASAPLPVVSEDEPMDLAAAVRGLEKRLILDALNHADGNKSKAARTLKLKRTTLIEKMKRLEISEDSLSKK